MSRPEVEGSSPRRPSAPTLASRMTTLASRMTGVAVGCAAVAAIGLVLASCGDDGPARSTVAFCERYADLERADPFGELATASPGEMRDAFSSLAEATRALDAVAPDAVATQARRYRDATATVADVLDDADYDPRLVDALAYRGATQDYADAAQALAREAAAHCE